MVQIRWFLLGTLIMTWFGGGLDTWSEPQNLEATPMNHQIEVKIDGKVFTAYKFDPGQKYPYFFPVNGPLSGESITTETSEPFPHHHSLFFGCDKVSGGDYWQEGLEKGQIVSKNIKVIKNQGNTIEFENNCIWQREGAPSPIADHRIIRIEAPSPTIRYIDFEITLTALIDVRIEKSNHALFSARVVPELSVSQGGTLVNSNRAEKEAGTFGQEASWCDYWGTRRGMVEGIAIFTSPHSPWYPYKWFTRDYGFFSPTPMYWLPDDHIDLPQ